MVAIEALAPNALQEGNEPVERVHHRPLNAQEGEGIIHNGEEGLLGAAAAAEQELAEAFVLPSISRSMELLAFNICFLLLVLVAPVLLGRGILFLLRRVLHIPLSLEALAQEILQDSGDTAVLLTRLRTNYQLSNEVTTW